MVEKKILIVGQTPDVHIERVISELMKIDVNPILIDRNSNHNVSFIYDNDLIFHINDFPVNLKSVWWRIKPVSPAEFSGGIGSEIENFRWSEWKHFLYGLPSFTKNAKWINIVENHWKSSFKVYQLKVAKEMGFNIPKTCISNSSVSINNLFSNNDLIIYKTLSSFIIPPDKIIYSSVTSINEVMKNAMEINLAPGIFQELIEKKFELRVTLVGDKVFCAKIFSQNSDETKFDWRRNQFIENMYDLYELDAAIIKKIRNMQKIFGLSYAAYDFIVTPNNDLIFLECNPGGQWLWLENRLGLQITKEICKILI